MATIVWTGGAGDRNWNNAANWSIGGNPAGRIPLVGDVVDIGAAATGPDSILVNNATSASIPATTLNNQGQIAVNSTTNLTDLIWNGSTTLQGGGQVILSDAANNRVFSFTAGSVLTNVDNTISGAGTVFQNSGLSIVNQAAGVIDATGANALILQSINITNDGVMQGSGTGGLRLGSGANIVGSGTIRANDGSHVDLTNGTVIAGQTLVSTGSGRVQTTTSGATLDSRTSQVHVAAGSTLHVNNATNLTLRGTLDNAGTLSLESSGNLTDLLIDGDVALTGGGKLSLSDNASNRIFTNAAGSTLTNVDNTIEGAGQIFRNSGLTFINGANGVVDANRAANALQFLNINVTNDGVMQGSGAGGLLLGNSAIISGTGTLRANDGSHVDLIGGTVISG